MTQTEFAHRLGVTPTYVGAMRKGMSKERLKTVFEMFPDLNRDWLLYGEGEMLLPEDTDMPDLLESESRAELKGKLAAAFSQGDD